MSSLVPYHVKRLWTRLGPTDVTLTGPADAPVVMLVNGLMGGPLSWERQLAPLGARFRVLVPELKGPAERETATPPDLTPAVEAHFLADLLDGLGITKVSLVALWRGARFAARFAAAAPARVERLALLSPAGILPTLGGLTGTFRLRRRDRVSALLPIPRRDLQRITAPAMVLVGERACPRSRAGTLGKQWRVLQNLVVTSVMPEAGLALHRDQPTATNALLVDFLLHGADWRRGETGTFAGPESRYATFGA
jgi:pimeloyl-ACP methyl ester carboxylesterase